MCFVQRLQAAGGLSLLQHHKKQGALCSSDRFENHTAPKVFLRITVLQRLRTDAQLLRMHISSLMPQQARP